ncbi:MAG: hypothetical protein AAF702_05125 [Chloroflexota bacterium]
MTTTRFSTLILWMVITLISTTSVMAQDSQSYALRWWSIASFSSIQSGSSYQLRSFIGTLQANSLNGGDFRLTHDLMDITGIATPNSRLFLPVVTQ